MTVTVGTAQLEPLPPPPLPPQQLELVELQSGEMGTD